MRTHGSPSAFADKIGPCAPPVKTDHGWLNLFHGVRTTMDGNPYVLGVALHDLQQPQTVRMSSIPVLFPSRADCRVDETDYVHVPNVVFSCAMLRRPDGSLLIYYAGNDTVMNAAVSHEDILAELCRRYGQDPHTGRLLYPIWRRYREPFRCGYASPRPPDRGAPQRDYAVPDRRQPKPGSPVSAAGVSVDVARG